MRKRNAPAPREGRARAGRVRTRALRRGAGAMDFTAMKVMFTAKEYARLLELVYLGSRVVALPSRARAVDSVQIARPLER